VGVDATRTWLIRLATVTGLGVLALAVSNALRTHQIVWAVPLSATALVAYRWHPPVIRERRRDSRNEPSGGRTS